jgi:hypothetical protein
LTLGRETTTMMIDKIIVNDREEGSHAVSAPVCMMSVVVESWLNESTEQFNLHRESPPSTPWDACISDPPALRSPAINGPTQAPAKSNDKSNIVK